MLKFNFRSLFIILGAIILLFVSLGCNHIDGSTLNSKEDTHNKEEQQSPNMTSQNDNTVSFRAEPYIQMPALSWEYSLDVKVVDGKIYINDVLYEQVPSSVPPIVLLSDGLLNHAAFLDDTNGNQKISNTLKRIKDCESCYVLETDEDSKAGKRISVYELDNAYYFVRFFENGEIMRIHYAIIEQEVTK